MDAIFYCAGHVEHTSKASPENKQNRRNRIIPDSGAQVSKIQRAKEEDGVSERVKMSEMEMNIIVGFDNLEPAALASQDAVGTVSFGYNRNVPDNLYRLPRKLARPNAWGM
jgi:hypothetical protein